MDTPPDNVSYSVSQVRKRPNILFKMYRQFGSNRLMRYVIKDYQKYLFSQDSDNEVDLLHVVDMVIDKKKRNYVPYIADVGYVGALANHTGITDGVRKEIVEYLLNNNCKAIIARSQASAQSILAITSDDTKKSIEEKIRIVYPAYAPLMQSKDVWSAKKGILKSKRLKLLFIGNYVHGKGLGELLDAYVYLRKRHENISLTVVANDYEDVIRRYSNEELRGVKCYKAIFSIEQLINKFYLKSHLFVMPSHHEVFGMVFLEALSTATPVIAINQYSTPEIVKDGYNGYLISSNNVPWSKFRPSRKDFDPRNFIKSEEIVVEQLVSRIEAISGNRELLIDLSKKALDSIHSNPQFTVKNRNKILKEIYDEALI